MSERMEDFEHKMVIGRPVQTRTTTSTNPADLSKTCMQDGVLLKVLGRDRGWQSGDRIQREAWWQRAREQGDRA